VNVPIEIKDTSYSDFYPPSFDIVGDETLLTTLTGYFVGLRIGSETATVVHLNPANLSDVFLSVTSRAISVNAVVLSMQVENRGAAATVADIGVTADINFDGLDGAPCSALPGRRGFTVHSSQNALTFITSGYPLVTDASTFWFGVYWNRSENGWTQVVEDSFSGTDSAMSFTWQGIAVGPGARVRKSAIVRFGSFETSHITLTLTFPQPVGAIEADTALLITGEVRASSAPSSPGLRLFLSIDEADAVDLIEIPGTFVLDVPIALSLIPAHYGLRNGTHRLAFYAIDADGDVSDAQSARFEIASGGGSDQDGPGTDPPPAKGSRTVVAILGAIGGSGFIGGLFIALLCYGRKRDRQNTVLGSGTASGTEGLKAYMADEILPG
jgi:hypothetical protein